MGNSKSDFVMPDVPDDVWIEILLRVDDKGLKSCVFVQKKFNAILSCQSFWLKRCARYGVSYPTHLPHNVPHIDYRKIYLRQPYGRNLIKNPDGEQGIKHWKVLETNRTGFTTEKPPVGADTIDVQCCFATSHSWGAKEQIIDLYEAGCDPWILDQLKPKITVSEWTASRFDCASEYILRVFLLRELIDNVTSDLRSLDNRIRFYNMEDEAEVPLSDQFENPEILGHCKHMNVVPQWAGRAWKEIKHEFTNYDHGARYVVFQSFGKDLQFWAGWYGSKMTKASVVLSFD